jgi:hypothetical protein
VLRLKINGAVIPLLPIYHHGKYRDGNGFIHMHLWLLWLLMLPRLPLLSWLLLLPQIVYLSFLHWLPRCKGSYAHYACQGYSVYWLLMLEVSADISYLSFIAWFHALIFY